MSENIELDPRSAAANSSGRLWILFLCALALCISFPDDEFRVLERWRPEHYLPLLAAWFANSYGLRAAIIFLPLSALALFRLEIWPAHDSYVRFGVDVETCIISCVAAFAFLKPSGAARAGELTHARSRWAAWAAIPALFLSGQVPTLNPDWGNVVYSTWYLGAALVAAVVAAAVNWAEVVALWRRTRHSYRWIAGLILLAAFTTVAFEVAHGEPTVALTFGFGIGPRWLPLVCFILAVYRVVDWRWLIMVVAACFVFYDGFSLWQAMLELDAPPPPPEDRWRPARSLDWTPIFGFYASGICAIVLGRVLAPFWNERQVAALRDRRSMALLAVGFVLAIGAMWNGAVRDSTVLLLGGIAFTGGLIWQMRGAIAVPLMIALSCLLIEALSTNSIYAAFVFDFSFVCFPYAFAGLLAGMERPCER